MDNNEDLIGYIQNIIKIINVQSKKEKQNIKVHEDSIIDIIKLDNQKICSCSKDKKAYIIKLNNDNKEFEIVQIINLENIIPKKIIYLSYFKKKELIIRIIFSFFAFAKTFMLVKVCISYKLELI